MYFTLITPPSLSPASICTNQSHYHYLLPEPCPNLAQTLPAQTLPESCFLSRPCPNLAPTLPRPCPNLAPTLRRRSIKLPKWQSCPNLAPTLRRRSIKLPKFPQNFQIQKKNSRVNLKLNQIVRLVARNSFN